MKLPEKIYIVERIPPETEKTRYWGRRLTRTYTRWSDVQLFVSCHPDSEFRIHETDVNWVITTYNP